MHYPYTGCIKPALRTADCFEKVDGALGCRIIAMRISRFHIRSSGLRVNMLVRIHISISNVTSALGVTHSGRCTPDMVRRQATSLWGGCYSILYSLQTHGNKHDQCGYMDMLDKRYTQEIDCSRVQQFLGFSELARFILGGRHEIWRWNLAHSDRSVARTMRQRK